MEKRRKQKKYFQQKKRVRQFNRHGIELETDRPERPQNFPGESVKRFSAKGDF